MIFPFRSRSIFRNRWIALLWAVGICYTATEIADSLSGVASKGKTPAASASADPSDPVSAILDSPPPGPPAGGPPPIARQAQ